MIQHAIQETDTQLKNGKDTLLMTSRELVTGDDELSSLAIGATVAEALVRISRGIEVRPRYIIAKVFSYFPSRLSLSFPPHAHAHVFNTLDMNG